MIIEHFENGDSKITLRPGEIDRRVSTPETRRFYKIVKEAFEQDTKLDLECEIYIGPNPNIKVEFK